MKICPVCSESFGDDFNFCDIDGTRLKRDPSAGPSQNKAWSLLGVGLLIGAVAISAAAIIFLPKTRVSMPVARSESQTSSPVPKPGSPDTTTSATAVDPGALDANIAVPVSKKPDKAQELMNGNANVSIPDPKAAATATEGIEKAIPQSDATAAAPPAVPAKPEPPPVVETREPAPSPKAAEPPAEKRESKPAAKSGNKNSDSKKKDEEKEKKKGGGFLKVFKKIFGKG